MEQRALFSLGLFAWAALGIQLTGCGDAQTDAPAKTLPTSSIRADRAGADSADNAKAASRSTKDDETAATRGQSAAAGDLKIPDGSADELLTFLRRLDSLRLEEGTREAVTRFIKVQKTIIQAADKLLAKQDLKPDARIEAIVAKWNAAILLVNLNDDGAEERFLAIANELARDPDPKLARTARVQLRQLEFMQGMRALATGASKNTDKLIEQVNTMFNEDQPGAAQFEIVRKLGRLLEGLEKYDDATKVYAAIEKAYQGADDPELATVARETAQTAATRLGWFGKEATLEGTQLNGEPFDLADYKGKVVLVDFWATWCGPCLAELPNVKQNYDKYRDRGFEVVGISRDEDREEVVSFLAGKNPTKHEIPWVTLWADESTEEAAKNSLAVKFGVDGLPETFLLDQEGKVVSIGVRGERLGEKLAELLGAPDEQTESGAANP